jgi:hypothetical protein
VGSLSSSAMDAYMKHPDVLQAEDNKNYLEEIDHDVEI